MSSIIWLASYPKSGNTWLRVFLTNLLRGGEEPAQINDLGVIIASHRETFDLATGLESSDLSAETIERLRPEVYEYLAHHGPVPLFMKVHDAYTYTAENRPLFPPQATKAVLYLIRNPLDVAVSLAHHLGRDLDSTITAMSEINFTLAEGKNRLDDQLRQRLLTWSGHVLSWLNAPLSLHVMRYEDMVLKPVETFMAAARFTGLSTEPSLVAKAVQFSNFEELQRQERTSGFRESSRRDMIFFRSGRPGTWRREMTLTQAARLVREHREVMQRFGYLTAQGEIVF